MSGNLNGSILTFFRCLMKERFTLYSLESGSNLSQDATMIKFKVAFIKIHSFIPSNKNEKTIDLIINGERLNFITDNIVLDETLNLINFNIEFIQEVIEKEIGIKRVRSINQTGDIEGRKELQVFLEEGIKNLYKVYEDSVDAMETLSFKDFIALITVVLKSYFNKGTINDHETRDN